MCTKEIVWRAKTSRSLRRIGVILVSIVTCACAVAAGHEGSVTDSVVRAHEHLLATDSDVEGILRYYQNQAGSVEDLALESSGPPSAVHHFYASKDHYRLEALPRDYVGDIGSLSPDMVSSIWIVTPEGSIELNNPQAIRSEIRVSAPGLAADAISTSVGHRLKLPLRAHLQFGDRSISEFLQRPTFELNIASEEGGSFVSLTGTTIDVRGNEHEISISLDPGNDYIIRRARECFQHDAGFRSLVNYETTVKRRPDSGYSVSRFVQLIENQRPDGTTVFRETRWEFSDLRYGDIDSSVFDVSSLLSKFQNAVVVDVAGDGTTTIRNSPSSSVSGQKDVNPEPRIPERSARKVSVVWILLGNIAALGLCAWWIRRAKRSQQAK